MRCSVAITAERKELKEDPAAFSSSGFRGQDMQVLVRLVDTSWSDACCSFPLAQGLSTQTPKEKPAEFVVKKRCVLPFAVPSVSVWHCFHVSAGYLAGEWAISLPLQTAIGQLAVTKSLLVTLHFQE